MPILSSLWDRVFGGDDTVATEITPSIIKKRISVRASSGKIHPSLLRASTKPSASARPSASDGAAGAARHSASAGAARPSASAARPSASARHSASAGAAGPAGPAGAAAAPALMDPIGILDPEGKRDNPMTGLPYANNYQTANSTGTYADIAKQWTRLPMYEQRNEILKAISENQVTLLKTGTGSGKTVLGPKYALHVGGYRQKVLCAIPKKVPTRSAAEYAAKCLDVKIGEQVGYYFKGARSISDNTLLTFTTTGSIVSRITGSDPLLSEYSFIVLDEAHERKIEMDMCFLLLKQIMQQRRDLKLVILSATIDFDKFRNYFGQNTSFALIDAGQAMSYPVEDQYLQHEPKDWKREAEQRIMDILRTTPDGDIICFVKSGADGRELCSRIGPQARASGYYPYCTEFDSKAAGEKVGDTGKTKENFVTNATLYKNLPHPNSDPDHPFTRKIVITTNVAESSITINGAKYVVDAGLEYYDSYLPNEQSRSMREELIAQSAMIQRRGRVGRTSPGICYHLYTKQQYDTTHKYQIPDVQKSDLSSQFLDLLRKDDIGTIGKLRQLLHEMIDPPSDVFISSGLSILYGLGAITALDDTGRLTSIGRAMSFFRAISPQMAKAIIVSHFYHCRRDMTNLAAILIEIDGQVETLFRKLRRSKNGADKSEEIKYRRIKRSFASQYGDIISIWKIYKTYLEKEEKLGKAGARSWCKDNYLNARVLENAGQAGRKISMTLRDLMEPPRTSTRLDKDLVVLDEVDEVEISGRKSKSKKIGGGTEEPTKTVFTPAEIQAMEQQYRPFDRFEDNIVACFAEGFITNIAKKIPGRNDYVTCFPTKKVRCGLSRESFLTLMKSEGSVLLYGELFSMGEGVYKMNVASRVPTGVMDRIVEHNKDKLRFCFESFSNKTVQAAIGPGHSHGREHGHKKHGHQHGHKHGHKKKYHR